ncbi:MAG TPA: ABC transporter permease subunit [Acidimicrobiales bacterium]|nr:ABC transporter permease subunit [Acidimicrobiales bacterium]
MITEHDVYAASAGDTPGAGSVVSPSRTRSRLRSLRTTAPLLPFFVYVALGLGVPTVVIINLAFRGNNGHLTMSNIDTITSGGVYLLGFETSLKLAAITSVLPAILGTVLAYVIVTSRFALLRRIVATASGVFANFGGVNLAFMFIATIGFRAVVTGFLARLGFNPWNHGFDLYKFWGVVLVYLYFQIPLMVLIITPAIEGLRLSWREAAQNLGATSWQYWRRVGMPVLMPSVLGSTLLLFGSALSAYATAEALTGGTILLMPIQIGAFLNGNVLSGGTNIGYALGLAMIVMMLVSVVGYVLLQRRATRWLR